MSPFLPKPELTAKTLRNLGLPASDDPVADEVRLAQALDYEAYVLSITMNSEDVKEGFAAFLEKREPVFKGR